jgi:hypothetical protein
MFKQASKTFVPLVALLLYLPLTGLYGQPNAMSSFEQGDYRAALTAFRTLEEEGETNYAYSYYIGRCLVALNEELGEAIELLYHASKNNMQTDAVFYLGRAYHLHYNFQDARRCYEAYERIASKHERKAHRVKHLIETCISASEITASYNPYEVMNVTFMDLSDSLQFTQVKMKGGNLVRKPQSYFSDDEDQEALSALMFQPKDPVRGDYMYFSGYARNKKDGSQIYRVRKGAGKAWGDPQEVSSLNSAGNEILPYFDPIENDLYFASDGKAGVGGYDLYRSHYDEERDQWTEPVNLGFPVNSVSDEYLLLPGTDLGMVLFFSNRQGTDSTVAVYRIHLVEPKKMTARNNAQELREIARLGNIAEEMLAATGSEPQRAMATVQQAALAPPAETRKEKALPAYQEILALALRHQVVSDSLKDLAASARVVVRESDDPNDRWVWQKQIMVWEKKAHDEEQLADQLYAQMELERAKQAESRAVNAPETIEVDRQVGELTVYRYTDAGSEAGQSHAPEAKAAAPAASQRIRQFEILGQSPYHRSNPIPMDEAVPRGTYYRIQLGAFGMEVNPDAFGGISPLTGEHMPDRGLVKYYAGKFNRYEDASSALPRLHSLGYEDAFIVAWYNGIQVSTQKAKQLE